MAQVTIGGNNYDVYANVADADEYFAGAIDADAWRESDADTKARALVTATRWIDAQCWKEPKPDPTAPVEPFIQACIVLAGMLTADPSLYSTMSGATASNTGALKRMKAGSVELEYFGTTNGLTMLGSGNRPFPDNVMAMLGSLLCEPEGGAFGIGGAASFDTCRPSYFEPFNKFGHTEPL